MAFTLPFLRQSAQESLDDLPALKAKAFETAAHILQGSHGRRQSGGHETFWQFRDYHEADRPQDIDWRQSAKTDETFIREKELHAPQSVYFWVQRNSSMDFRSESALYSKQETAQILGLATAMLFVHGDERVGILGQSRVGRSNDALDRLARNFLDGGISEEPGGKAPVNAKIVLCGDFLDTPETLDNWLSAYSAKTESNLLLQILDPAERNLSFDGHVVFDNHSKRYKIDNVAAIRDAYQAKIRAHNEALQRICAANGFRHYLHVTDTEPTETLLKIWQDEQQGRLLR